MGGKRPSVIHFLTIESRVNGMKCKVVEETFHQFYLEQRRGQVRGKEGAKELVQ